MSDSKHTPTPGPWSITPTIDYGMTHYINADGKAVASVYETPNAEANARLIAAAPEMLEALEWALPFAISHSLDHEACERARAALSKARGE